MNRKTIALLVAGICVVLGGALCLVLPDSRSAETSGADGENAVPSKRIRNAAKSGKKRAAKSEKKQTASGKKRIRFMQRNPTKDWELDDFDDEDHPYSAEDKKVALELQKAGDALDEFDDDDFKPLPASAVKTKRRVEAEAAKARFYKAVEAAMRSKNPSVRSACVDACSWRGDEALPELTGMMADADPGVAESALDAAQTALDGMENPNLQFETAAAYMQTFAGNEEARDMFSSTLVSAASDLIDAADDSAAAEAVARGNRERVVDTLAEMIEKGSGEFVQSAKDAFEEITTEEWVSREEAKKWAQDPENYEAPE